MKELSQITDLELRQELRKRNKLQRQRSRKAKGLGPRKKGMGCRIGDRDEAEKVRRGYCDPSSYVRRDGSEKLVGLDWKWRVAELRARSGGTCEMSSVLDKNHAPGCDGCGTEPHHIVKRSVRRDDRALNLADLSHACHDSLDPRKIRSGKAGA